MDVRKLILFGGNSHVISLPKKWLDLNGLSKGDPIYLETEGNKLILNSGISQPKAEKMEVVINIDKGMNETTIERNLFGAYVHGATMIVFSGVELKKHSNKIIQLLKKYVALEIVEHTGSKILAKTYIDSAEVDVHSFIRRIDNTIRSMLLDLKECFESEGKDMDELIVTILQREENIDKIKRMLYRVIFERLKNPATKESENPLDNLKNWESIKNLEKISNQIKYVSENILLKHGNCKDVVEYVEKIRIIYEEIMKCFYKNDVNCADNISQKIKECRIEFEKNFKDNGRDKRQIILNLLEYLRDLNRLTY